MQGLEAYTRTGWTGDPHKFCEEPWFERHLAAKYYIAQILGLPKLREIFAGLSLSSLNTLLTYLLTFQSEPRLSYPRGLRTSGRSASASPAHMTTYWITSTQVMG